MFNMKGWIMKKIAILMIGMIFAQIASAEGPCRFSKKDYSYEACMYCYKEASEAESELSVKANDPSYVMKEEDEAALAKAHKEKEAWQKKCNAAKALLLKKAQA